MNVKQLKGIANHLATLHHCPLIKTFMERYNHLNIPFSYTPLDTPMDIQSQSQSKSKKDMSIFSKSEREKKPKPFPMPDNFCISPRVREWAKKNKHTHLEEHLEALKLRAQAKGYKYLDWDAALMTAIRENWGHLDLSKPENNNGSGRPADKNCPKCHGKGMVMVNDTTGAICECRRSS